MDSFAGKFDSRRNSFLYRAHPIRGRGTLKAVPIGLKVTGFRGGEEERPALILGGVFLALCIALLKLGFKVAINWGVLIGFAFLLFLFAFITQRRLSREALVAWTALGSLKTVEDDKVEVLVKYRGQTRYLRFVFDKPEEISTFLQDARKKREMELEEEAQED